MSFCYYMMTSNNSSEDILSRLDSQISIAKKNKNYKKVIELYGKKWNSGDRSPQVLVNMATIFAESTQFKKPLKKALTCLLKSYELGNWTGINFSKISKLYYFFNDYENCRLFSIMALSKDERNYTIYNNLAISSYNLGYFEEARKHSKNSIIMGNKSKDLYLINAHGEFKNKNLLQGIDSLEKSHECFERDLKIKKTKIRTDNWLKQNFEIISLGYNFLDETHSKFAQSFIRLVNLEEKLIVYQNKYLE